MQNYLKDKCLIVNKFNKIVNKEVFRQFDGFGIKNVRVCRRSYRSPANEV